MINFPATIDLTRLNIYAPSIKQLLITSRREPSYSLGDNAASFISSAQAASLAPNLKKLTVVMDRVDTQEYIRWVTMFLSPRLLDVQFVHFDAKGTFGLSSWTVLVLLVNLSLKCPSLQRLDFCLSDDNDDYEFETRSTLVSQQRLDMLASFRLQLSSFCDLRTLESSILALRPGILSALGELPHLETLSIKGDAREPRILDLTLPDSSFPALRNLELWRLHWANLRYMSEFAPLLHRLTKLSMTHDSLWRYQWEVDGEMDWRLKLMCNVAENAPLLTDLTMNFDWIHSDRCVSSDWLDALQHLRLKRLSLTQIRFECSWSDFASALPHLEAFKATDLGFWDIYQLARGLPQLRLLEFELIDLATFGEDGEHEVYSDDQDDDQDEDEGDVASNIGPAATRTSKNRSAVGFSGVELQLNPDYVGLPTTEQQLQEIAR